MQYRTLDEQGDYTLGQNSMKQNKEAVAQAIKTRLGLLYGQWWENTEDGLPLFEKILGAYGDNKEMIDILISERIAQTKDVKEIKSYQSSFQIYCKLCCRNSIWYCFNRNLKK